jgi:hypothetical protein
MAHKDGLSFERTRPACCCLPPHGQAIHGQSRTFALWIAADCLGERNRSAVTCFIQLTLSTFPSPRKARIFNDLSASNGRHVTCSVIVCGSCDEGVQAQPLANLFFCHRITNKPNYRRDFDE